MLEHLNSVSNHWEGLWLPASLFLGNILELLTVWILVIEFRYDKEFNEQLKAAKRDARKKKIDDDISICSGEMR